MPKTQRRLPATTHGSQHSPSDSRKQAPSWIQELKTSEMHHPAASIIGSGLVIHDVADIPQPIRIPFSCNGGEHSWNYSMGCITRCIDCALFKPCFKTIRGSFLCNPEIWKQYSTLFKYLNGLNCISRHNSNSNMLKRRYLHSYVLLVFKQLSGSSWTTMAFGTSSLECEYLRQQTNLFRGFLSERFTFKTTSKPLSHTHMTPPYLFSPFKKYLTFKMILKLQNYNTNKNPKS